MSPGPWIPAALYGFHAHVRDTERKPGPYRWTWVIKTQEGQFVASGHARTCSLALHALREQATAWRLRRAQPGINSEEDNCPPSAPPDAQDQDSTG